MSIFQLGWDFEIKLVSKQLFWSGLPASSMPAHKNPTQRTKPCGADILYNGSGEHSWLTTYAQTLHSV